MANDYKRLCAIIDTTKSRHKPLELLARMGVDLGAQQGLGTQLWLVINQGKKQLAAAPVVDNDWDAAARDVARQLTLDRTLPRGMDDE